MSYNNVVPFLNKEVEDVPQKSTSEMTGFDSQRCSHRYTAPPDHQGDSTSEIPPYHTRSCGPRTNTEISPAQSTVQKPIQMNLQHRKHNPPLSADVFRCSRVAANSRHTHMRDLSNLQPQILSFDGHACAALLRPRQWTDL